MRHTVGDHEGGAPFDSRSCGGLDSWPRPLEHVSAYPYVLYTLGAPLPSGEYGCAGNRLRSRSVTGCGRGP